MSLTRTRRIIHLSRTRSFSKETHEAYSKAQALIETIDTIYEDAEESLEDQMRIHRQCIDENDVTPFVERSSERLVDMLFVISDPAQLVKLIIEHNKREFWISKPPPMS